jgi:hypothetical protein
MLLRATKTCRCTRRRVHTKPDQNDVFIHPRARNCWCCCCLGSWRSWRPSSKTPKTTLSVRCGARVCEWGGCVNQCVLPRFVCLAFGSTVIFRRVRGGVLRARVRVGACVACVCVPARIRVHAFACASASLPQGDSAPCGWVSRWTSCSSTSCRWARPIWSGGWARDQREDDDGYDDPTTRTQCRRRRRRHCSNSSSSSPTRRLIRVRVAGTSPARPSFAAAKRQQNAAVP